MLTSGMTASVGGTGLTSLHMMGNTAALNMPGFDFNTVWRTVEEGTAINGVTPDADGYPILRALDVETQLLHTSVAPGIPPEARAVGDFNNDGCTNFQDFVFLLGNWGVEFDGTLIGFVDFLALLEHWGQGC